MERALTIAEVEYALSLPTGERPRIYGEHGSGVYAGQAVRVPSLAYLDKVSTVTGAPTTAPRETISRYWTTDTTISDLIGRI